MHKDEITLFENQKLENQRVTTLRVFHQTQL